MRASMDEARTGRPAGFAGILDDIKSSLGESFTLSDAVDRIVTFNGRLPLEQGLLGLTPPQRALYSDLGGIKGVAMAAGGDLSPGLAVGAWSFGRIILCESGRAPSDPGCLWGHFPVPEERLAGYRGTSALPDESDPGAMAEMDAFYSALDGEGALAVLDAVEYMVDHVDPVLIYCGDMTYTLFGKHNNLLPRGGAGPHLIPDLRGKPLGQWTAVERSFIFNMVMLKRSDLRAEEFNGRQLCHSALRELWAEKSDAYARAVGRDARPALEAPTYRAAETMRAIREEYKRKRVIFRDVHGLNFHKTEGPLDERGVADAMDRIGGPLAAAIGSAFGTPSGLPLAEAFSAFVTREAGKAAADHGDPLTTPFEEMIAFLVRQAARESDSDIAMSRGFRNLRRVTLLGREESCREASAWPATDYYCCALPSGLFQARMEGYGTVLFTILNAISKRMEYNSWHYTPGHFSHHLVPPDRHYYLPPSMPDFARWSNQHHSGHMLSNVMYSIRSPGGLSAEGRTLPGVFDLRLMRQSGRPYGLSDLYHAVAFTRILGIYYQTLLDHILDTGIDTRIDAFTKDWYSAKFKAEAKPGLVASHA